MSDTGSIESSSQHLDEKLEPLLATKESQEMQSDEPDQILRNRIPIIDSLHVTGMKVNQIRLQFHQF